jgi:hypothetical protein
MAKIAGIGRRVLLNSLENCAKTARDPRENENSAGLAAGETSLSRFLATASVRRGHRFLSTFSDLCWSEVRVKIAQNRAFCANFGRVDVLIVNC